MNYKFNNSSKVYNFFSWETELEVDEILIV